MEKETVKEKVKVVMLPTDNGLANSLQPISNYTKPISRGGIHLPLSGAQARREVKMGYQAYHIYIISDEKPQNGDYCLDGGSVFSPYKEGDIPVNEFKKIIATTDKLLGLPGLSKEFLEEYIAQYNRGNVITVALVEYEEKDLTIEDLDYPEIDGEYYKERQLKVSKYNTVNIYTKAVNKGF